VLIIFGIRDFALENQLVLDFILRILKRKYGKLKLVSEKDIKGYLAKITIVDRIEESINLRRKVSIIGRYRTK
jgi:hypothetical protein